MARNPLMHAPSWNELAFEISWGVGALLWETAKFVSPSPVAPPSQRHSHLLSGSPHPPWPREALFSHLQHTFTTCPIHQSIQLAVAMPVPKDCLPKIHICQVYFPVPPHGCSFPFPSFFVIQKALCSVYTTKYIHVLQSDMPSYGWKAKSGSG